MPDVVTRFAPSPTGFLHIGGARTALFNWLYARHHGGRFLLRIEDTDRKRSTQEAIDAIIEGLKWLGMSYDGEIVYQSKRIERHKEVANLLVEKGRAYHCYCSEDEVTEKKTKAREEVKIYKHKCTSVTSNVKPVVRFKVPDSKRHGATSVCDYEKMRILPKAMRNYLLRLGWSHGNDEIISDEQAIEWFNLESIGRSPARLDFKKLEHLNNHYISNMSNEDILALILGENTLTDKKKNYLLQGLTELKKRANYLAELLDLAQFYIRDPPLDLSEEAEQIVKSNLDIIKLLASFLSKIGDEDWNKGFLSSQIKEFAKLHDMKISDVYHSLRAPITGVMDAPGIIDIMVILGKDECIRRLQAI